MLILKGSGGKSYVMERLLGDYGNSMGVFYANDYPYISNTYVCKRSEIGVHEFIHHWLYPKMEDINKYDDWKDFLVIYTDLEEDSDEFCQLVDDIKVKMFPCTTIVLMCK